MMWAGICSQDLSIGKNDGQELCLHNLSLTHTARGAEGPLVSVCPVLVGLEGAGGWEGTVCGSHGTRGTCSLLNGSFHLLS